MKVKIAVEMELDLTGKDTEMIEANPAEFCEEFAKTLASYATGDVAEQGAKCVYVDHAWMCDGLCENDRDYNNGILNGVLDGTIENLGNDIHTMLSVGRDNKFAVGEQYEAIIKARKAVKKTIPQKVTHEATLPRCCTCPYCKNVVDEFTEFLGRRVRVELKYCKFCGQALDWSEKLGINETDN